MASSPPPEIPTVEPVRRPDLDSLASSLAERADTLAAARLPALEEEIRAWLGRLEYGDSSLVAVDETDPRRALRPWRGRLYDALGWASFRRGDLRQAEAALVSAVAEINSRGTTEGYALHFYHLGRVLAARSRWGPAVEALLDAELRGLGGEATPELEEAYLRLRGSLNGLDALRARERARIEDERRQLLVTGALSERLPAFRYPTRTGPPFDATTLAGRPSVVALWDAGCEGCASYAGRLAGLAAEMRRREGALVGVWLGGKASGAGPAAPFPILVPDDPEEAQGRFGVRRLPTLLVVDGGGRIRFRWSGPEATPPPSQDVLVQVDHLRRRETGDRPAAGSEAR
ncbi:MAG TPA: TlpA disulfide reductase family protein [Gemmatimonadota bacterium]|nr:TlpA disulfide reductase family protein [Gemmatimonadota bacterium]